ncbi:hypothetical protein [Nocardia beijingensis]
MVRGQARPVGCGVGVEQVVDEGGEVVVENGDGDRGRGQPRIARDEDRSNSHTPRRELRALRDEAFTEVDIRPDPVDLALAVSDDLDRELLRGYLEDRLAALRARRSRIEHQLGRRWPDQNIADDLIVEHATMRIQAEISWHEKVLGDIDKLDARRS